MGMASVPSHDSPLHVPLPSVFRMSRRVCRTGRGRDFMDYGRNIRCLVLLLVVAVSGVEETCQAVPEEDEEGNRGVGEVQDMETGDEENQDDRGNGAEDSEGKRGEISMGLRSGHGYGLKVELSESSDIILSNMGFNVKAERKEISDFSMECAGE